MIRPKDVIASFLTHVGHGARVMTEDPRARSRVRISIASGHSPVRWQYTEEQAAVVADRLLRLPPGAQTMRIIEILCSFEPRARRGNNAALLAHLDSLNGRRSIDS